MLNLDYSQISSSVGSQYEHKAGDYGSIAISGLRKETIKASESLVLPDVLVRALAAAAKAEEYIEPEQSRIRELLALVKNDIEREAREFQLDYVEKYLKRAANLAQTRIEYLAQIKTRSDAERELEKCANDKAHWFQMYAWGYDPRARTPLSVVPFELYPRQKDLVAWLDKKVFDDRSSGIIEKARDEGATEVGVRWGIHNWRFRAGFSMLLSSRTDDEVDTKKKQGTLFERARFQIRLLPLWMLPKKFNLDKDLLADKMIANPNGNEISGQAPVENMGRGDRVTVAFFDEFAFWRFAGYPQFRSMSQTTDSIIMPSSVAGRLNQYADIASDNVTDKFVMDWRDNPFKDIRWYNALPFGYISPKMSRTTIAQEIDRDYDASQPGKVWQLREELVFITQSEFLKPFEDANLGDRFFKFEDGKRTKFKIPDDFRFSRYSDYGKSAGHDWSYLLSAQPTPFYPLADTQFVFVARNLEPTGLVTAQAVKLWREYEAEFGLRDSKNQWLHKPFASYNSHEQKDLRKVLLGTYGENWYPWKTDYHTGIEQITDWWTPIEVDKPNPFRPQLMGRCRLVFVAIDGEYEAAYNERQSTWFVTMSQTEVGFMTARKQISAYHYPETELGKAVKAMRPVKEFDDIVDCLIAGTTVITNRGEIPIETITTDDLVWTREGWKRVKASGLSYQDAETYTLIDEGGNSITATGNHRIFTHNKGFVALRELGVNDKLFIWQNSNRSRRKRLFSTVLGFIDTPTQNMRPTGDISTRKYIAVRKAFSHFILKYGNITMDWCQMVTTSITPTGTPTTTIFPIWNASQAKSIGQNTPLNEADEANHRNNLPTSNVFDLSPSRGTLAKMANDFIARMVEKHGQTKSSEQFSVIIAEAIIPLKPLIAASVLGYVNHEIVTASFSSLLQRIVRFVRHCSPCPTTQKIKPLNGFAQTTAVKKITKNVKRADVYNLTVTECPEYFANGILVHNCLRALAVMWNLDPPSMTADEKFLVHLKKTAPELLPENITKIADDEQQSLTLAREQFERQEFEKKQKSRHVVNDGGIVDYMADEDSSMWREM